MEWCGLEARRSKQPQFRRSETNCKPLPLPYQLLNFLNRVFKLFHLSIKKGPKGPDYLLPPEVLTMMNIFIEAKSQIIKLCALDSGDLVRYQTSFAALNANSKLQRVNDFSHCLFQLCTARLV